MNIAKVSRVVIDVVAMVIYCVSLSQHAFCIPCSCDPVASSSSIPISGLKTISYSGSGYGGATASVHYALCGAYA